MSTSGEAGAHLARYEVLATPSYCTLIVHDATVDVHGESEAFSRTINEIATSDRYNLYLCSRQQIVPARVEARVWSGPVPVAGAGWEGMRHLTLHSETGRLYVRELAAGVPGDWALPEPGTYDVTVRWRHRADTERDVNHTFGQAQDHDWSMEELSSALTALAGREFYRLDLWLADEQEALGWDDEDDDEGWEPV